VCFPNWFYRNRNGSLLNHQHRKGHAMNFVSTAALGGVAGLTILVGLPVARLKNLTKGMQAFLNALATGVLVFLLVDIVEKGTDPIKAAAETARGGSEGGAAGLILLIGLFVLGLGVGLVSLVYFDRAVIKRNAQRLATGESTPRQLALTIAVGIGLHNFSEGLAIGQASRSGALSLALLLIIGFGLHNATEGFGVAAPLTMNAGSLQTPLPTWAFLGTLGLIAGGPTFIGTIIGFNIFSEPIFVLCLALAAGSIVYVLAELFHIGRKMGTREILAWGLFIGFLAAFGTDLLLTVIGA
jgi:ZIP family zinc transporter